MRIGNPWRRVPRGATTYSGGLPKAGNRFLYYIKVLITGIFGSLVLKFGPSGREVDVKDDSLDRWYVDHYKYDPERKQVRHVFLKAFSNRKGQIKYFNLMNKELQARKLVEEVPRHEHITGGHYEPGYHARIRENRRQNGGVGSNIARYESVDNEEVKPAETE